jgi:hypothetical protein
MALVATCLLRSYEILGGKVSFQFMSSLHTYSVFQGTPIAISIFAVLIPWLQSLTLPRRQTAAKDLPRRASGTIYGRISHSASMNGVHSRWTWHKHSMSTNTERTRTI